MSILNIVFEFWYVPFLFWCFYLLIKEDTKGFTVSDVHTGMVFVLLLLRDGLDFEILTANIEMLFFSLGATFAFKVLIENIVYYTNQKYQNFEFGDGDVLLIGVLGMALSHIGYFVFILTLYFIWIGLIFINTLVSKNQKEFKLAFVPYIILSFVTTTIISI